MRLFEVKEATGRTDPDYRNETDMRRLAIPPKEKNGAASSAPGAQPGQPATGKAKPSVGCFSFTRCLSSARAAGQGVWVLNHC